MAEKYCIYNTVTWRIMSIASHKGRQHNDAIYDSERVANAQFTKLVNKGIVKRGGNWKVESHDVYLRLEPEVDTYNMLDPERKLFKIRASLKGTNCDPATERYHSE